MAQAQKFTVTAPVKGITATIVGVDFVKSVAETDNEVALAYFRRHRYKVVAKGGRQSGSAQPDTKPADGSKGPDSGAPKGGQDGTKEPGAGAPQASKPADGKA